MTTSVPSWILAEEWPRHTLRYTYRIRLVGEEEVNLVTVATLMGHKSLDSTAVYTQPSEEETAKPVEKRLAT